MDDINAHKEKGCFGRKSFLVDIKFKPNRKRLEFINVVGLKQCSVCGDYFIVEEYPKAPDVFISPYLPSDEVLQKIKLNEI